MSAPKFPEVMSPVALNNHLQPLSRWAAQEVPQHNYLHPTGDHGAAAGHHARDQGAVEGGVGGGSCNGRRWSSNRPLWVPHHASVQGDSERVQGRDERTRFRK